MNNTNKSEPATKADLEKFATKDDLKKMEANFETKFATKDDLKKMEANFETKFATKDDLKSEIEPLKKDIAELKFNFTRLEKAVGNNTIEILNIKTDIRDIKETMSTKDDINRIMNAIDAFAGEAKNYRIKDADRGHVLMEHHDKLENHENRISAVEARK
ncbi:MAG: hypothetical protein L6420_03470 [Elusimicrobia bacterium]|nr:hypothetical protein [Elusimicrobiota bacterium]